MHKELSFRIFVIHHRKLNDAYYKASMLKHFTFVNVNTADVPVDARYQTLKLTEFSNFTPLGKWYTESEVMYNLYQNQELYADVDYIGFIQYDMDASGLDGPTVRQLLQTEDRELILFQPYTFGADYNQRVLMDPEQPNTQRGAGRNCYETIFADYNAWYGEHHRTQAYSNQVVGLCSAFLMRRELFNQMMAFASPIIESGKLNSFDTKHKYRIQGGLLERYYAAWMMLQRVKYSVLPLPHSFDGSHAQMGLYQRAKSFFQIKLTSSEIYYSIAIRLRRH